jgi:hypothetical protein
VTTGSARDDVLGARFVLIDQQQFFLEAAHLDVGAELARDHQRRLRIERRVDRHHQPLHQQLREHVLRTDVELVGEVLDRHALRERDVRVTGGGALHIGGGDGRVSRRCDAPAGPAARPVRRPRRHARPLRILPGRGGIPAAADESAATAADADHPGRRLRPRRG